MADPLTADDVLPLVDRLSPQERERLLRLIAKRDDSHAYRLFPPGNDEFSTDSDQLSWDAEGWEGIG